MDDNREECVEETNYTLLLTYYYEQQQQQQQHLHCPLFVRCFLNTSFQLHHDINLIFDRKTSHKVFLLLPARENRYSRSPILNIFK